MAQKPLSLSLNFQRMDPPTAIIGMGQYQWDHLRRMNIRTGGGSSVSPLELLFFLGVPFSDTTKLSWIIINSHKFSYCWFQIPFYHIHSYSIRAPGCPSVKRLPRMRNGPPAKVEHGVRIAHGQDGRWDEDPPGHSRKSPGCLSFPNFTGGVAYVMLCDTD